MVQTSGSEDCHMSLDGIRSPVHTVFVGDLEPAVTEAHLHQTFSVCGPIRSLQVWLLRAYTVAVRAYHVAHMRQ